MRKRVYKKEALRKIKEKKLLLKKQQLRYFE